MAPRIKLLIAFWSVFVGFAAAQTVTSDVKDIQVAKQKLQIGTDNTKFLSSIAHSITAGATHNQSPTAKAVYDYIAAQAYLATVSTNARLTGNGTVGSPLDLAQQGATSGQVLKWNGTSWAPATDAGTTYTAGTGIDITGTVVTNTGDTDASNDITTSTTAAGDLDGTYPSPTVDGLQNRPVASTAPSSGQVLKWNGTSWAPAADEINDADASATNEGSLTVGAGGSNSSTIASNTTGSTAVTISGSTTALVTESGSTITVQADTSLIATVNDVNAARNRNDSTFVRINGSYDNKRVTSNVWRGGTTLLQGLGGTTSDTSGLFILSAGASATKPGIWFDGNQQYLFEVEKDSRGDSVSDFTFVRGFFDNVSSAGDNQVLRFGWNKGVGGGRKNTANAALGIEIEEKFNNAGWPVAGSFYELHVPDIQFENGGGTRPLTGYFGHTAAQGGYWGMNTDFLFFNDYSGTAKGWISFKHYPSNYTKGITFLDTAVVYLGKPQVGVDLLRVRNAANSSDLSVFRMDASNRLVINQSANGIWTYSPEFIFNTLGTITTSDGNPVQIGDATRKSFVSIYAPGSEVLRLRSNTGGSNLWITQVNSDNITWQIPSGTPYIQAYNNAPYLLFANNRIGLGTSPSARFHIRQDGNTGSGGLQLTNSDASFSFFEAVDASGRLVWYQNAGGTRMVLDQTGSLAVGTTTNPVSKLDVEGGATIGATYAGTNAAPTNGLLVEGNVGIGNNSPSQKLHITGNARVTGAFYDSNNDAGTSGQTLKSTVTGTDWQASQAVYSFTRALPTTVNNSIFIGILNKTGNGANVFQLDIQVQGGSVSIGKTYLVNSSYNSTLNAWQILLPVSSTGAFGGSDFAVEIRCNNNIDSLRIRRTSGTSATTAYCELRHAHGGINTFTEISTTDNPTTITAIYVENAITQVDARVGIGVAAPANVLDVEGAAVIGATYSGTNTAPTNGLLVQGDLAIGNTSADAKLDVTGSGNTSGTNALLVENSDGTDIFIVRNDQNSSFGTSPQSTVRLTVRGSSADTTARGLEVQRSSGTGTLVVRNDGKVSVNNAFLHDALNVNGDTRTDGLVLTNQTASTSSGKLKYNNGGATHAGFLQLGDGDNATIIAPKTIQLQAIDYDVDWTTGRTKAFWTVPSRYNGYKVSKCYVVVSSIGSGNNIVEIEKGGVGLTTQTISSSDHTITLNNTLSTGDIFTFDITSVGTTASKGLFIELELATN